MLEAEDLRIARRRTAAYLIAAISLGVIALAILFYVLWQIFASVKATSFDADGVRCYAKADQTVCLKTAEPPR